MRTLLLMALFGAMAVAGCARTKPAEQQFSPTPTTRSGVAPAAAGGTNQALIVTPERALVGKVVVVNAAARYVVLNFPLGKMATVEQRLNLYRRGLKVGEVKVTGPQREDNIVADLVAGEAEAGDEVRSE